ncbi:putative germin-like protein 9-2 [Cinnamomum micranthum f. kanehirae]|uniref:Germin-like protein n=1 Tax=Cinnamomum micranthum f. kanehirae TaxID=337451 RepID=A0A3S3MHV9_9MAGN|nr:putative germin-like protein 9-2 [Cinnamomum micranthum f. kanehirae]
MQVTQISPQDFIIPPSINVVDGNFFTYTGMRGILDADTPATFNVTKATMAELPALNGQSVSSAVLRYPAGGSVNPPHTHPRSAELLLLIDGTLEVGFIDTTNKLYTQTLQIGDVFVFPKSLFDRLEYIPKISIYKFGLMNASAGTVSVPSSVFASGIDDAILAKSFKTDVATIQKIKAGLAPKA